MGKHVVIVGGGLAGLAAAVALAPRGFRVTILESRPRWGGRASSFVDQTTGEPIDNCQHVSLGCCTNFKDFCETVGTDDLFVRERRLTFIGPDGRESDLAAAPLPAPLHLLPALVSLKFLSLRDKWKLVLGLRALARSRPAESTGTFRDWLQQHGQPPAVIDRFWHVVLVSALSETLDRIDVGHARKVFVDAFLANRAGWEVWLPNVPLDNLYGAKLEEWLADHGVTAKRQAGVKRVLFQPDGALPPPAGPLAGLTASGVELRSGETIAADHVILAVPHHTLFSLLPDEWTHIPELAGVSQLETAPISSAHLWFDRPITALRHATLVGRQSQWLFNRSQKQSERSEGFRHAGTAEPRTAEKHGSAGASPSREPASSAGASPSREPASSAGASPSRDPASSAGASHLSGAQDAEKFGYYYQVVISASRDVVGRPQEDVIREVVAELAAIWPVAKDARLLHSRLVTEHKAVVSMLPGVDNLRPLQQSPVRNLQIAGDWTRTGWPGTMEGAVRSGYLAAENVLRQHGADLKIVQPDLPVAVLSKLLFGL